MNNHVPPYPPPDPDAYFSTLRRDYDSTGLRPDALAASPVEQLRVWMAEAAQAGIVEPNAMTLATVDTDGRPSARTVLLKRLAEDGLAFFTNLRSAKARALAARPYAACVFHWFPVARQVIVRGPVERLPDAEADAYFASRPRGSQLSAWASDQSSVLPNRETLEGRLAEIAQAFGGRAIPRPPHWGGFVVRPDEVEFWQGRPDRLHDRLRYSRSAQGWRIERLAP